MGARAWKLHGKPCRTEQSGSFEAAPRGPQQVSVSWGLTWPRGKTNAQDQELKTQGLTWAGASLSDRHPSPTEPEGSRLALAALTTVLLVRVILAIVVPVTHPGTADALAVVTVKVKRGAGGQHWVRGKKRRESVRYTSSGRLSRARNPFLTPLFQVSHLNHSPSSDSCACPPPTS